MPSIAKACDRAARFFFRTAMKRKPLAKGTAMGGNEKKVASSFVVRTGPLKSAGLQELVMNLRKIMEPHTASKLKERRNNKLKDYTAVAGNLGVSHMLMLSQTLLHTTLRMLHFPRGPSLVFDVLEYSLMKDVVNAMKKPFSLGGIEYKHSPLVILDGFDAKPSATNDTAVDLANPAEKRMGKRELELVTVFLQNLFPSIQVATMNIHDAKRVLLFHYDQQTDEILVRHYLISLRVDDGPITTASSSGSIETMVDEAREEHLKKVPVADLLNDSHRQKSVNVVEAGPRLRLKLTKILDGFNTGKSLYSRFVPADKPAGAALTRRRGHSNDVESEESSSDPSSSVDNENMSDLSDDIEDKSSCSDTCYSSSTFSNSDVSTDADSDVDLAASDDLVSDNVEAKPAGKHRRTK